MSKRKQPQPTSQSNQAGFTIIESLLAIIVVTILMVGLSPVIVLSVATRVQAKRVERGTEAARAYIDGVRSGAIISTTTGFPVHTTQSFKSVPSPTSATGLYCADLDGGGCSSTSNTDLYIQAFRNGDAAKPENGYKLGIRVYRADAFADSGALKTMGTDKAKAQTFSGGLGDRKAPQFETTTEIAGSGTSLKTLCDRIPKTNPDSCS
ncbi:prepilin-type N-terminal cleavage/methylation domain-containing protein [Trichocoleus sp. DQ-U1]|uniref:prepilin-type N-terminal cleavage/methylation domain-containing protein n=1 Tax=Trichocoleus sp. DQ-U1 TaxID=2933926 RepID=UPI003298B557